MGRRSLLLAGAAVPVSVSAYGQCVTGSPAVDACRGGVRVTGSTLPPGVSLDLSFMTPGTLDPRITFTRASTATYTDFNGVTQTAGVNAPRWDYTGGALRGLLIEEARTNVLLNSAALSTQGVAVTAQAYTLSFYGTGTITMSGAATGALVGTAAGQRVSQTFTPTAGTLTCTVTGSVLNAQLEAGSFVTSVIITTAAAVTRAQDNCAITPANMGFFSTVAGTWFAEFIDFDNTATSANIIGSYNVGGAVTPMFVDTPTLQIAQWDGGVTLDTANSVVLGAISRAATGYVSGTGKCCLNGGTVATSALTGGYFPMTTTGIGFLTPSTVLQNNMSAGYIRRVSYWPRVLSDAEMQQVTT